MNNREDKVRIWGKRIGTLVLQIIITVVVIVVVCLLALRYCTRGDHAALSHTDKIDDTPVHIAKMRSIGQWEFLAIRDEELVDTVRHGFFGDDELSRIYYGTVRLGIDLHQAGNDLLTVDKDTVIALLPPVRLLDNNFLDEARTKTFYESGKWSEADRQALTARARQKMLQRCMTPSTLHSAELNATAQINQLLRSMGYRYVKVRFKRNTKK